MAENRSPAGARPGEAVYRGYLTVFGARPSRVTLRVVELGLGRRLRRAVVALLICWALALVAAFVILAHFILVPGFLAAGLALAFLRFRPAHLITKIHGVCPRCATEQDFEPPSWGRTVDCPRCKNQLTLTWLPGRGTPASPGSLRPG